MRKILVFFLVGATLGIIACKGKTSPASEMSISDSNRHVFPVTDYLLGQLNELDSMPITPLYYSTINDKTDSVWKKREDIRKFAQPFLDPIIDSVHMAPFFVENSFLDQTINSFTLNYTPRTLLPKDFKLKSFMVYIDPATNKVMRIYLVKETSGNGTDTTRQLTWVGSSFCRIVTILQKENGGANSIQKEEMKWGYE